MPTYPLYQYVKQPTDGKWAYRKAAFHPNGKPKQNVVVMPDRSELKCAEGRYCILVRGKWEYLLPQLTKEDIGTIEKEFQKVLPLFADANGKVRSSWCRMNLADRATKVGLAPIYGRLNRLSSGFIHGTIGGLTRHFVLEEDKDRIAIPPSLNYCDLALISGHQLMCFMVETLANTFGWVPVHPIETLVADFKYAWNVTDPAALFCLAQCSKHFQS